MKKPYFKKLDQIANITVWTVDGQYIRGRIDELLALPRCIGVRQRGGTHHAVLRLHPDNARSIVERELGIAAAPCRSLPLEEMFIELVGDRR